MRTIGRVAKWSLVMALLAVPAAGGEEPGRKDEAVPKLDGVWTGFTVEGKGETPDRGPVHLKLTIKGDHVDAERLDGQKLPMDEGTVKLTPGKPMQMDGTSVNQRGRAQTFLGIAELTGDTLKWCVSTPNNPRPTEFETKRPSFLVILKRQKP
ncbi:MAG TPA: TIGR03067 domain-containing protein [Planctomycetota bacterium]|nr:TIGR03067 domain-containing protein [Planctomycetota bacterium]HRR80212.1 TIGR03067 domain-containing protein [Planctomycetota bacterium]HRT93196.1 TIGR03067 domain-containing protein [Planctomycetota bacterium]